MVRLDLYITEEMRDWLKRKRKDDGIGAGPRIRGMVKKEMEKEKHGVRQTGR